MLVLLLAAGALGLARPRRAWLAALLMGSCLAAAHAGYVAVGVKLPYSMSPPGWLGALSLLLLLPPAFVAAYAGAAIGRVLQRRTPRRPVAERPAGDDESRNRSVLG